MKHGRRPGAYIVIKQLEVLGNALDVFKVRILLFSLKSFQYE